MPQTKHHDSAESDWGREGRRDERKSASLEIGGVMKETETGIEQANETTLSNVRSRKFEQSILAGHHKESIYCRPGAKSDGHDWNLQAARISSHVRERLEYTKAAKFWPEIASLTKVAQSTTAPIQHSTSFYSEKHWSRTYKKNKHAVRGVFSATVHSRMEKQ